MSLRAIIYAYIIGGFTLVPLLIAGAIAWTFYTSVPAPDPKVKVKVDNKESKKTSTPVLSSCDQPRQRKAWLLVRKTFEEKEEEGSYVGFVRSFLDARSKDPKRSRPKDTWYVVLKGDVLYLYEDEAMSECELAIHLASYKVAVYPEGLPDAELFTRRNAICLKPLSKNGSSSKVRSRPPSQVMSAPGTSQEKDVAAELDQAKQPSTESDSQWFIFVRSCTEMEDWYLALAHASTNAVNTPTLQPLEPVFSADDMLHLIDMLDEQPDVIPMRWMNALVGRLFFSFYRTEHLEAGIISRMMKKLSKVKLPAFLQNISVTEVSVGKTSPMFSKPMLKELTKEGDASMEVRLTYKGEVRITVEATAIISLGQRFKPYLVKLVLACVLRELDGNLLVKMKRPPSNRIWYAFTHPPTMVLDVEPVVSDRQIKWSVILSTIGSRLKEIINESIVLPNMDDIAFFDSHSLQQRGGIYADAQRKDRPSPTFSDPPLDVPVTVVQTEEDLALPAKPVATNGNADVAKTEPRVLPDPIAPPLQESRTLALDMPNLDEPKAADVIPVPRTPKVSKAEPTVSPKTPKVSKVEPTVSSSPPRPLEVEKPVEEREDQSQQADGSTTSEPVVISPPDDDLAQADADEDANAPSSRPASTRSRSSTHGSEYSHSSVGLSPERPPGSHSTQGSISKVPTTSSFLSSLKSKAVDKQTISNTAKEAMKKWSANWAGFKREHFGEASGEDGADSDNSAPAPSTSTQAKRASYAEIKAAVATKIGRERDRVLSSGSIRALTGSLGTSPKLDTQDELVPIPRSPSPTPLPKDQTPDDSVVSPKQETNLDAPQLTAPDISRNSSTSTTKGVDEPPVPPVIAPPIYKQPSQGASMTIPGIHASHKNEVMSLGYTPPAPPPASAEPKLNTPAIQSVYRLFRSPILTGQHLDPNSQTHGASTSGNSTDADADSSTSTTQNPDVTPLSLSAEPTVSAPPRPIPPPLPPRTTAASAAATTVASSDQALGSTSTSASDALKFIASQDLSKRQAEATTPSRRTSLTLNAKRISGISFDEILANFTGEQGSARLTRPPNEVAEELPKPSPPPLPPRRTQASSTSSASS